ncbi:MAG: dTDP-4-dehydrorhamnose reductase [Gemmataceae bacterium]|nr:dTDP-4-dehydrorhamnose reductase [Gemmataceae bacterium]
MKVALIGSGGQLGSDLVRVLAGDCDLLPLTHAQVEICDGSATRTILEEARPDVVINATAFHKVEECEERPERALQVNAFAVRDLARTCHDLGSVLVHISTDYVFGSSRRTPHKETDAPEPLNAYGISKLAGEHFVRVHCPRHFIVRTCGLYGLAGASGKGGNFVELMIRLAKEDKPIKVVDDQLLTPTATRDLAGKIKELIETERYGLYHVTSSGQCSWYEFAGTIFRLLGLKPDFGPTTTASFGSKVQRPAYSVLTHEALIRNGFEDMRPWPEALRDYLEEKGHLQASPARAA